MNLNLLPASKHFHLEQLAEGVFAAIATPGGASYSNFGIIDLGDQTLIFDTGDCPQGAADLRSAALTLTGREPAWVIDSHFHGDHVGGNMVYPNSYILSTPYTRKKIIESSAEIEEAKQKPDEIVKTIAEERQRLEGESSPERKLLIQNQIARWEYTLESLEDFKLVYPTHTFESEFTFYGSERTASLIAPGEGHTKGDAYLLLPDEKIAFLGDLGFFGAPPFMPGSNPAAWCATLEHLAASDVEAFVPGHGAIGSAKNLHQQREYMLVLRDMIDQARRAGETLEQVIEKPLPSPFDAWQKTSLRHERNLRFFYSNPS